MTLWASLKSHQSNYKMDEEEHQWKEVEKIVSGTCLLLLFLSPSLFFFFCFLLLKIYQFIQETLPPKGLHR